MRRGGGGRTGPQPQRRQPFLTLSRPLRVARHGDEPVYCVDGTPTDSVHLAITGLLEHTPDMVVSGINDGANMGDDVLYSGTVAAAIEGVLWAIRPWRCHWWARNAAITTARRGSRGY